MNKTIFFIKYFCVFSTIIFVFNNCAITINTSANRFDSPESIGNLIDLKADKINANLIGGSQATNEFVLTEDFTEVGPNTSNPTIREDRRFRIGAGIGLEKNIDLEYRIPGGVQFKYQWFGENKKNATKGNFSFASSIAYDYASLNSDLKGSTSFTISRNIKMIENVFDFAAILGYRLADYALVYGGPFIIFDLFRGSHAINNNSTNFRGSARTVGWNLGMEFDYTSLILRIEGAYTANKLGSSRRSILNGGVVFGGYF